MDWTGRDVRIAGRGTVLVADDDRHVLDVVARCLEPAGYAVLTATDGREALRATAAGLPDLAVLEVAMPALSGFEVMRRLRSRGRISVILVSARCASNDRVLGLRQGADDYVCKPFSVHELVARIDAILRRARVMQEAEKPLTFPGIVIDRAGHRVYVRGSEVRLTPREYDLLLFLAHSPGQVFSSTELMERVWGCDGCADTSTVPVHIRRLRSKVEREPGDPRSIQTVWGAGYSFHPVSAGGSSSAGLSSGHVGLQGGADARPRPVEQHTLIAG